MSCAILLKIILTPLPCPVQGLFGSSSAVTATGYDDSTDTVHVGTSAGRSDFIGLNRINNTTTAVSNSISASNGVIAEN